MYESFFGLTGLPFQLNPDPSFLFHGKGHRDAFAALREGLAAGARIMVLTGEVGAGKTTLLQALLASVDPASTATVHVSVSGLDAETLSSRVLEALGQAPVSDSVARRDALLARLRSGPLATLLVIDEAQHLDASAFELLETMTRAGATAPVRLQICLVGQPELRFLINAAERGSFRELIDVDRHLRPLEQTEIRLYVEHRLHRAGWTGRPEFEDAAFDEIYIFTAGIPRRVNLLCNSLMLSAWLKKLERIDAPAVARAAAALRGDSPQGAPDLLELESALEHPPTLTEAVEFGAAKGDGGVDGHGSQPWSCPNCDTVNPTTLTECWKCDTARPASADVAKPASEASPLPQVEVVPDAEPAAPDAVHADVGTSTSGLHDLPPPTMGDPPLQDGSLVRDERINARLAGLVYGRQDPAQRRRKTILVSVASVAVALAVIGYVVDRQTSPASLSQSTLRDVVAGQSTGPPASAPDQMPTSAASLPATPSSAAASAPSPEPELAAPTGNASEGKRSPDSSQGAATGETLGITDAAPQRPAPAASVPAEAPMPSCSGQAAALGLCETERSSSTRRQ
jgi:type II secretory pathway predicted ATPase ExeA